MNALTQNNQAYNQRPAPADRNTVPLRWFNVLALHLAGHSAELIAEETGYSLNSVYRILKHGDVLYVRQQLLESTQQEFEALFKKVVHAVRNGLDDPDPKVGLMASSLWLKAHGKFAPERSGVNMPITAEDVVIQILNGNVQAQAK